MFPSSIHYCNNSHGSTHSLLLRTHFSYGTLGCGYNEFGYSEQFLHQNYWKQCLKFNYNQPSVAKKYFLHLLTPYIGTQWPVSLMVQTSKGKNVGHLNFWKNLDKCPKICSVVKKHVSLTLLSPRNREEVMQEILTMTYRQKLQPCRRI